MLAMAVTLLINSNFHMKTAHLHNKVFISHIMDQICEGRFWEFSLSDMCRTLSNQLVMQESKATQLRYGKRKERGTTRRILVESKLHSVGLLLLNYLQAEDIGYKLLVDACIGRTTRLTSIKRVSHHVHVNILFSNESDL